MTTASTLLVIGCSLTGAAVGAVTPLLAYRRSVEYGAPLRATCASCDSPLPSGVGLAVTCAGCGERLGPSPWWTVPVGAVTFGFLAWAIPSPLVLLAALVLAGLALPLAAIDLAVMRLPDPLVLTGLVTTSLLLTAAAAAGGDWPLLLRAVEGGAVLFGVFLVLAVLPGAGLGFGDVKLAGVLGLLLGYLGWSVLILAVVLPWLVNGPVAVVAIIRRGRKATQPFGPALLAGAFFAIAVAALMHR